MTGRPSSPETIRQGYRPAAPIQRFNNKSLNWPAWFRHFRAVADVHGWSKEQRALQLVSYLDETDSTQLRECRLPALGFTPDRAVIMKTQTHSLTPLQSCAGSAIHKVRRNYGRN